MSAPVPLRGGTDSLTVTIYPAPTTRDIDDLALSWDLHPLLIEDLKDARPHPKLDHYGEVLFLATRSASYVDHSEEVVFSKFHLLLRPGEVAILCPDGRWIDGDESGGRDLLEDRQLLERGPQAVVYRMLDRVVDSYWPVLEGLAVDKEEIESQVFGGDAAVTERIYRLSREVVDVQHALASLARVVEAGKTGSETHSVPPGLQVYLLRVTDHLTRATSEVQELREALAQILGVNATLVAQRQNEDMKKISGWAAILFAPTLIAAIYGMNFKFMPELHWTTGYPLALGAMLTFAAALYGFFKWKKWM